MSKKIPKDWIVVTIIALLGVSCLIASHKMKEDLVQNAAAEQAAH